MIIAERLPDKKAEKFLFVSCFLVSETFNESARCSRNDTIELKGFKLIRRRIKCTHHARLEQLSDITESKLGNGETWWLLWNFAMITRQKCSGTAIDAESLHQTKAALPSSDIGHYFCIAHLYRGSYHVNEILSLPWVLVTHLLL